MTAVMTPSSFTTLDHHHHSRSRRRECLGLVTSMRMSMDLSMKAVSVVLCCVMMTLPASSFNKGKRKPTPHDDITDTDSTSSFTTSTSTEPPHKRARTSPSLSAQQSEYFLCCHYRTLMIESDAEVVDIKKAHRKMAVRYHPDKNTDASAQEMFVRIQEAYETLSDPIKRHTYDTKMRHHIHQHHSTPLTHDDTADEPAYDIFGRKKSLSRRSRLARYIFSSRSQPTSSSLVKTSPISSAIFALVCAALFVCVVLPSFVIMLVSGMVLSLSTATYRLLRSSQYTSVPARMNN